MPKQPSPDTKKLPKFLKLSQDIHRYLKTLPPRKQNAFIEAAIRRAIENLR